MSNYQNVMGFLSSSEINRCNKHGVCFSQSKSVKEWNEITSADWLTRKLRRKLGHLYQLNLLPVKYAKLLPLSGMNDDELSLFNMIGKDMARAFMEAEDKEIMGGLDK